MDNSGAPTHIKALAHRCLACELSTRPEFRNLGSEHPHLLEIADRIMRDPGAHGHPGRDKALQEDAFKMAWAVYRYLQPSLQQLCDVAWQTALENKTVPSTKMREAMIGKVFVDDSPKYNPARRR